MQTAIRRAAFVLALLLVVSATTAFGQTGKVVGTVTDVATGEPLPGVNVTLREPDADEVVSGAVTNGEGYYNILNVSPGTYRLRASFVGFAAKVVREVRVSIDETTTINVALEEETVQGEEVVVTADRDIVQTDVGGSQVNITSEEIEDLAVSSVQSAIQLQAGIEGGLSIRNSGSDEVLFNVNGLTLRDERNNSPFTSIPLSSVSNVQVKKGGFEAQYGTVRSGVVNVVTKEGSPNRYEGDFSARFSPAADKHFGPAPNDPNGYFTRPYLDPEVAFQGTDAWPQSVQDQYPTFEGWVAASEALLNDDNPDNDMSPSALQQAYRWQHRKRFAIDQPDYTIDVGVGGPLLGPGLSKDLGDLRFYASYRRTQNMYVIPLSRDRLVEQTGHLKVTSDLASNMKLSLEGMLANNTGTVSNGSGQPGFFDSVFGVTGAIDRVNYSEARVFTNDYWAPTRTRSLMLGGKFTHTLGDNTFYTVRLTRFSTDYETNPGDVRDTSDVVSFGGVGFDEAPFGYYNQPTSGVGSGMRMSIGMSTSRDTSRTVMYNAKADLTSQINQYVQVQTGLEFNITDSDISYGEFDPFLPTGNFTAGYNRAPRRGAAYGSTELSFKGLIANAGLRLNYFNAGGDWFEYDPFTDAFSGALADQVDTLLTQEPTEHIFALSPRLSISFPVTTFSKLFFNYGHFRSMPDPDNLFSLRRTGASRHISRVGSPNNPLPKTVSYEVGYQHSLLDEYLLAAAGYYKDVNLQPRLVSFSSRDGQTTYSRYYPNSYEDIRGFELSAKDRRGWLQGFVNYTYSVAQRGYFGADEIYQNQTRQRQFNQSSAQQRAALSEPVPRPFARFNLELFAPEDFGPQLVGAHPLGDWRVSLLGTWRDGSTFTWAGAGGKPGVANNVSFVDYWNWNLRLKKNFNIGGTDVQFFADVFNLFNQKRLTFNGFADGQDYLDYMRSLHLPASDAYPNEFSGDDQPGVYRDSDTEFVPLDRINDREELSGNARPEAIYYEEATEQYIQYEDGAWRQVSQDRVDDVMDSKAYIDMPNLRFQSFLSPRDIFLGMRFEF
jgi:hypothetical protein